MASVLSLGGRCIKPQLQFRRRSREAGRICATGAPYCFPFASLICVQVGDLQSELNGETAAARLATLKIWQASCVVGALTVTSVAAICQIAATPPSVATPNARVADAFTAIPLNVTRVLTNALAALPAPVLEAKFDTRPSANAIVAERFSAAAPDAVMPSDVTRTVRPSA